MTETKENSVCQSAEGVTEERFKRGWIKLKRKSAL